MTNSEIPDWERKHYSPGGADPFLYYVAFGDIKADAELSASHYRCVGIPDGIELTSCSRDVHPDVLDSFMNGHLWDRLQADNPTLASEVKSAPGCIVLQGDVRAASTLNYLRDTVGLLAFFLDKGAIAIYDPQMFQWWSPAAFRERIFDPAKPVPRHHTIILISDEEGLQTTWIHTRGMRKFGRPDISVRHVRKENSDAVIDLCNRFIELQAFGGIIPEGQEVSVASLPPGGVVHYGGDAGDPDFNNEHIQISWRDQ